MQWCLINGCCTCHAQPRIFKKGDDVSPLWQAVAEGSGGRHGLAGGDKGLESGALKIAKQTLRRRMHRAVWIGDFGTDNYWLVLSGFKESLLMCFYVQHSAIIFGKMTKSVGLGWSPHYDELIGTVSEGCQYWEGNTVPIVQDARAETVNFRMERWVEPASLESVYFFSMVSKLCQSRVRRDCSPSKQSKLLHAQKYIEMERETFGGLRHRVRCATFQGCPRIWILIGLWNHYSSFPMSKVRKVSCHGIVCSECISMVFPVFWKHQIRLSADIVRYFFGLSMFKRHWRGIIYRVSCKRGTLPFDDLQFAMENHNVEER